MATVKCRLLVVCWSFRSWCSLHIFHMWHNFKEKLCELKMKMKVCVLNVYPVLAIRWNRRYKEMNTVTWEEKKSVWFAGLYWIYIAVLEGKFWVFRSCRSRLIHLHIHTCGHRRNVYRLKTRYHQVKIAGLILRGNKIYLLL